MQVPGHTVERGCSYAGVSKCDFDGVVAVVCSADGRYVGQACDNHIRHAMFCASKYEEELWVEP
jgi:hypothetical protein